MARDWALKIFKMDWLGAPLAMEPALDAVAGEIVAGLRGPARVDKVKIVEVDTDSRSALTRSFERKLDVRVTRRLNTRRGHGWRSVGGGVKEEASYRLEGGIERHEDKLVLHVFVYLNDKKANAVEEHITLTSVSKKLLEAGRVKPVPPADGEARGEVVTEKHALHEAVKAGDMARIKALLAGGADVNGRDGRFWTGLMHAAGRGYTLVVEELLRAGAVYVSWEDAKAYVRWLSWKTGKEYRLLSEGEWEYVARARTGTRYTWGHDVGRNRANCDGCGSANWWEREWRTAPVGSFEANGFGLHDVHGNVWEWVEDCWHGTYSGAPTDGSAWVRGGDCSLRVLRGGSWSNSPGSLRSASRLRNEAGLRDDLDGFRVARTLAR